MNIEEFISSAISGIVNGLELANDQVSAKGAIINPLVDVNGFMEDKSRVGGPPKSRKVQQIEITMAVTVSDTIASGGKFGLNVMGISAEVNTANGSTLNNSVSTVKFNVPIALPVGK